jgi:hypothetical protein
VQDKISGEDCVNATKRNSDGQTQEQLEKLLQGNADPFRVISTLAYPTKTGFQNGYDSQQPLKVHR